MKRVARATLTLFNARCAVHLHNVILGHLHNASIQGVAALNLSGMLLSRSSGSIGSDKVFRAIVLRIARREKLVRHKTDFVNLGRTCSIYMKPTRDCGNRRFKSRREWYRVRWWFMHMNGTRVSASFAKRLRMRNLTAWSMHARATTFVKQNYLEIWII